MTRKLLRNEENTIAQWFKTFARQPLPANRNTVGPPQTGTGGALVDERGNW